MIPFRAKLTCPLSCLLLSAAMLGCARLPDEPAAPPPPPPEERTLARIEPNRAGEGQLGFGWSKRERGPRAFRWVERMEADLYFELEEGIAEAELWISAAPHWLNWKRQRLAVYVNGRFAAEWLFPESPDFQTFHAVLPSGILQEGKNVVTLRAGYKVQQGRDPRELSVAVGDVVVARREGSEAR